MRFAAVSQRDLTVFCTELERITGDIDQKGMFVQDIKFNSVVTPNSTVLYSALIIASEIPT